MATDTDQKCTPESSLLAGALTWPGRFVGGILGPPKTPASTNGQLRYRACEKCASSVGIVNVLANTFLMVIKGYLGVVGGSTALVADAIHSSADVVSSVMLLFGLRIAKKPVDQSYPYGYGKVEFLVAVVIYSSLILAGIVIFIDAISCILHKNCARPDTVTLIGALLSVVVNEMMFRQSVCAGTQLKSPSMVANAYEKRSDALSSVAVFIGIAGAKMGWSSLDPAAAILVAFYILKSSGEGLIEAFSGLMDRALDSELVDEIRGVAKEVEGVLGIALLRTREVGQMAWVDIEILVDGDLEVLHGVSIKNAVKKEIAKALGRTSKIEVFLKPVAAEAEE